MRVNHTYGRGGALDYLAAYDVHAVKVFGRTEERTGIVPFMNLATPVMSQEPCKRQVRVLDRRQRLLPSRSEGGRPAHPGVPEHGHGPHPRARLLAQPIGTSWDLHEWRYSGLTHLGEAGASLLMLMAESRHRKPENVRRYFRPSPEAIAEVTGLLAPGDAWR